MLVRRGKPQRSEKNTTLDADITIQGGRVVADGSVRVIRLTDNYWFGPWFKVPAWPLPPPPPAPLKLGRADGQHYFVIVIPCQVAGLNFS